MKRWSETSFHLFPISPDMKLPAHRASLRGREISFWSCPLIPPRKAGLAGHLPVIKNYFLSFFLYSVCQSSSGDSPKSPDRQSLRTGCISILRNAHRDHRIFRRPSHYHNDDTSYDTPKIDYLLLTKSWFVRFNDVFVKFFYGNRWTISPIPIEVWMFMVGISLLLPFFSTHPVFKLKFKAAMRQEGNPDL